jgi:hypothetical protein
MRILGLFLVVGVGLAPSVLAQQSAADCADLEDDRERLECYDRYFSGGEDRAETEPAPRTRAATDTASRDRERTTERRAGGRAAAATEEPASPEDSFGRDNSMLDLGGEEMATTAVGDFDYWREGQRVELSNGQVWEITNETELYHPAENPQVTIEKGFFSSYYLRIDGLSKALRVRRVR